MEEIPKVTDCYYFIVDFYDLIRCRSDGIKKPKLKKGCIKDFGTCFSVVKNREWDAELSYSMMHKPRTREEFFKNKTGEFADVDERDVIFRRVFIIITEDEEEAKKYYKQTIKDFAKKLTKKLLEE